MKMKLTTIITMAMTMTVKKYLSGNNPSEATQAKVEGNGEAKDEGEWQPGHQGQVGPCLCQDRDHDDEDNVEKLEKDDDRDEDGPCLDQDHHHDNDDVEKIQDSDNDEGPCLDQLSGQGHVDLRAVVEVLRTRPHQVVVGAEAWLSALFRVQRLKVEAKGALRLTIENPLKDNIYRHGKI